MSLDHLFKAQFTTGQTIKIVTPRNAMLDACEVNIGKLTGKVRSLPAILCDGVDESDPWHIVNLVDSNHMLLDHIAVKGAVSLGQAERLCQKYMPQMQHGQIRNIVTMTDNAMKTFIDSATLPNNTPFVLESDAMLLDSMSTTSAVQWDENNKLLSHGGRLSGVMYDMACCDTQGELVEQVTARDIASLLIDESCVFGGMLDAMMIKNRQFDDTMQKIAEALKTYDNEDLFVKSVTPIEPFKRNGVVNIGAIFTMSDTQTITVLFNNPDTTPAKLTPDDVLTSWKWMLNKRDVTATLQPRAVESKKFPMIAGRIIKLLARNHDRFKRAQMLREKDMLLLNELIDQVEAKQSQVRSLDAQTLQVQADIDAETIRKQNDTEIGKANNEQNVQMNNETHVVQKANALKQLLISEHGFSVDASAPQSENTFNLLTANGAHLAILTFIDETANDAWTLAVSSGGTVNRLANIDTRQSIEDIAKHIIDFDQKVTVISSDQIGNIDQVNDVEQLRNLVEQKLSEMKKKDPLYCPALKANVHLGTNVLKKTIGFSADIRKLKALVNIKELLLKADRMRVMPNRNSEKKKNVKAFHLLKSSLVLDGKSMEVRYLIREDNNGHYHYDNTVEETVFKNAESPLLDGLSATVFPTPCATHEDHALRIRIANCQLNDSIENNQNTVNGMLDDATGSSMVLNMFIVEDEQNVQMNNDEMSKSRSGRIASILIQSFDFKLDEVDEDDMGYKIYYVSSPSDKVTKIEDFEDDEIEIDVSGMSIDFSSDDSDQHIAKEIAMQDYGINSGFDVEDDRVITDDSNLDGFSLQFAHAVSLIEQASQKLGLDVAYGNFTNTTTQDALFDSVNSQSKFIYGLTAQVGFNGVVIARIDIDETGDIRVLKDSSGTEVAFSLSNESLNVASLVSGLSPLMATNEQNVQMNNKAQSKYSFKGGSITITQKEDVYSVFLASGSVGGEFEGKIKAIQAWLAVRLQTIGEAVEGQQISWDRTAEQLTLVSGEDVLGLQNDFVSYAEIDSVKTKFDLAKLIVKKLSNMEGWKSNGSTAVRDLVLDEDNFIRYKFNVDLLAEGKEFRIDEVMMSGELDISTKQAIVTYAYFTPTRESVEHAVKSLEKGVIDYIENKLQHTVKQSDEQNVQMNNEPVPEPKKGVVFKAEAESVYRSIDYSVLDYHGHTSDEFKRAKVKERLEPKIAEAEALLTRRFRNEFQRQQVEQSIKNAKSMIERWESKQVAPEPESKPEVTPEPKLSIVPDPVPETVVDAGVSENEQFLNDIISGTADMSDEGFSDKLLALAENLDPSLEELFEQASDAYADYAISLEV